MSVSIVRYVYIDKKALTMPFEDRLETSSKFYWLLPIISWLKSSYIKPENGFVSQC